MHPDVADACVVSIQDEYSGELPLAYIVVHDKALQRIAGNKTAALKLKAALAKVHCIFLPFL
jgi:4-coumarate--CoA ligase